ncbi:MAG: diacylglycerol kinase [Xanthomonadales bacterium]|jgi:diacylglycerol kinase (ATP)|nr:diacylglycerol kinase [Xanthomonadales bacterium]
MKPGKRGIARIIAATGYSWQGLKSCYRSEAAFRQELWLCAVLLAGSFWVAQTLLEWILLIAPLFLLLIVELLNSAVEAVVDRIGGEHHELSGRAKDMGSAAVLLCLVLTALTWMPLVAQRLEVLP